MAFMKWTSDMSVGVALLDSEHKQLIRIINQLYEGMSTGSAKSVLKKAFDAMVAYTGEHFGHEEQFFEQTQYPLAAEHKAQHEELRQLLVKFRGESDRKDNALLALELLCALKEWLEQHIMRDDKKYSGYLNGKGIR
ncbi:MAG: bacteriohemerythrin [Rhizomicrobium sp.]|jgi:hemerythrin-like metal-binding protein